MFEWCGSRRLAHSGRSHSNRDESWHTLNPKVDYERLFKGPLCWDDGACMHNSGRSVRSQGSRSFIRGFSLPRATAWWRTGERQRLDQADSRRPAIEQGLISGDLARKISAAKMSLRMGWQPRTHPSAASRRLSRQCAHEGSQAASPRPRWMLAERLMAGRHLKRASAFAQLTRWGVP